MCLFVDGPFWMVPLVGAIIVRESNETPNVRVTCFKVAH